MEQAMKLTDTQLVLLSRASQRPDRCAELPITLKGGAVQKVVARLLDGGLLEEVQAASDMPAWRGDENGVFALRITEPGLSAISVDGSSSSQGNCAAEAAGLWRRPRPNLKQAGNAPVLGA
jgi:hypothetical protein